MDFIEPCFGIGHNLSLICQMTSEDIKQQLIIIIIITETDTTKDETESASQPIQDRLCQSVSQPVDQINQSTSQSVKHMDNRDRLCQSVSQPVDQINQSTSQSVKHMDNRDRICQPVKSTNRSHQSINQSVS